jgi:hypothetical protein
VAHEQCRWAIFRREQLGDTRFGGGFAEIDVTEERSVEENTRFRKCVFHALGAFFTDGGELGNAEVCDTSVAQLDQVFRAQPSRLVVVARDLGCGHAFDLAVQDHQLDP